VPGINGLFIPAFRVPAAMRMVGQLRRWPARSVEFEDFAMQQGRVSQVGFYQPANLFAASLVQVDEGNTDPVLLHLAYLHMDTGV